MYKLIIAEDEKLIRDGFVNLIKHSEDLGFEVVGEAEDGEQAMELTRAKKPDVILTDINMPRLSGLEFIECVRDECPDAMIIIITGYDDYHYMQKAMQLGVKDYLMKPILPEQIREILVKTKDAILRQQKFVQNIEELKKQVLESLPIVRERFFNELISGRISKEEIDNKSSYLKIDFSGELYCTAIIKIKNYIEVNDPNVRKEDLIQFFLFDIINEIFKSHFKVYSFAKSDTNLILLICVKDLNRNSAFMQINQSIAKLVSSLQKYLNVTVFASIGTLYEDICSISTSYEEANEAIIYSCSSKSNAVINYEDICSNKEYTRKRATDIEEKIILHAKLCERNECREQIHKLFRFYISNKSERPHLIKMDIFELVLSLLRDSENYYSDSEEFLYDGKFSAYNEILKYETLIELEEWMLCFFEEYINKIEKARLSRSYTIIEKVKELVDLFIGDEDFTLDDVASKLFISPNYLRQIFKQKTGESFVEYLTRVRMEKAAEFLQDSGLKVQQVAEKVGYENQQYFALCFKKHFKCTPSEFRKENVK